MGPEQLKAYMSIASQKRLLSRNRRALLGMRARPRSGKVARLPYATREQINQLIEDGFPYKAIIEKLTQDGLLPYPVSERNLSSWRLGGHQEWHWEQQKKQLTAQLRAAALRKLAAILD